MSYARDFQRFRGMIKQMSGTAPVLRCISPRSTWTVPTGYAYDAQTDTIHNSAGQTWRPDASVLPYTEIDMLPASGAQTLMLDAGGLRDGGERSLRILPDDVDTVRDAAWCVLDNTGYVVSELTPEPAGAALWYMVRLRKR